MFDEEPIVANPDLVGSLESDDGHSLLDNIKEKSKYSTPVIINKESGKIKQITNFKRSQQAMIMSFKDASPQKLRNLSEERGLTH